MTKTVNEVRKRDKKERDIYVKIGIQSEKDREIGIQSEKDREIQRVSE